MTERRRRILIALAVAGAAIVAVMIGVKTLLPSWLRGRVERVASQALGRDLTIAGPIDVSFSLTPRLTAGDIALANAPWGSEPSMVRVGRVTIVFDLASLWSRPARVRELEIADARLLLEANGEGHGNWRVAAEPAPGRRPGPATRPSIVVDRAALRGLELTYRPHPDAAPVTLGVREFEARLVPETRMIDVRGDGRFAGAPWEIAGQLGTLDRLREGHDIDLALAGRLGESRIETRGHVRDPLSLGAPDLDVSVEGPDIVAALGHVGLRSPLAGAFRLHGRFTPAPDGVDVDVNAAVGGVTARAHGVVRALLALDRLDLTVEAAGPDAAVAGSWIGVQGLPPRAFDLAGRVRRAGDRFSFDDATIRVGLTSLAVAGVLPATPRCVGTDLTVHGRGQDLSELSSLTRLRLPPGPFEVGGRFLRRADGLAIDGVELRCREALIRAGGTIGEPPRLPNLDLTIDAEGPDLAWFSGVATVDLPHGPFAVRGRVARDGPALALDAVEGRLGDDTVSVTGRLVPAKRLEGTDVRVRVAGPDLAQSALLPTLHGVPAEPFDGQGRVLVVPGGYELDGVEASVGRVAAAVEGRIGAPSALDGTALSFSAHGPALSDLAAWGFPENLPADPFSVVGGIRVEQGVYHADHVVANVGPDRAAVDGALGVLPDLSRFDAAFDVSGPSVADLGRFFAASGFAAPRRLPGGSYAIGGRVRHVPPGYELVDVHAKVGETAVRVDGTVGSGNQSRGVDLRFDARAPDTSLLADLAGTAVPEGPFEAHGRLARVATGLLVDGVVVAVGDARAALSGTLGAGPEFEGTDLRIDASGPDLAATLGPVTGLARLPRDAFEVAAQLAGSIEHVAAGRFAARLGGNDLEGRISMRLDGKPAVDAELRSKRLDVSGLLAGVGAAPATGAAPAAGAAPATGTAADPGRKRKRFISDDALEFGALRKLDATLRLDAAEIALPGLALREVVIAGELRDGALRLDRLEGTGINGGHLNASLALEPLNEGYRLRTQGRLDGGRLVASAADKAPEIAPSIDIEFDLKGEGRSLHDIAASGDGRALAVLGSGPVPLTLGDHMASPLLRGLLETLNPFRTSSDHTDVECGIAFAAVTRGTAVVEPIAVRTDKMTVTGQGKVDFDTEDIDLTWIIKPREGVGISAGSIATPYIKLGGTLSSPRLDVKPLEAVASTGAAVATAGLTILFKGIYDRVTAEKKVCVEALAKAQSAARP